MSKGSNLMPQGDPIAREVNKRLKDGPMNRTEYDLVKASETRQLKNVELVDFDGRTLISIPWEIRFQAFKCFWNNGAIYRFSFVFNWTAYYQRSGVLDIITLMPVKDLNQ